MLHEDDVILFQGDSITDAARDRSITLPQSDEGLGLGRGYVLFTASALKAAMPGTRLKFHNRGVGGDKSWQLAQRWQVDCIDLKPDVLSILVGVNDTWHAQSFPNETVPIDKFNSIYRKLLDDALAGLPNLRIVLCEPFTLPCGQVNEKWFPEFDLRRRTVQQIAQDYNTVFVPFQTMFDQACEATAPEYWAADGVHPTIAGHMLMAQKWISSVCGPNLLVGQFEHPSSTITQKN